MGPESEGSEAWKELRAGGWLKEAEGESPELTKAPGQSSGEKR